MEVGDSVNEVMAQIEGENRAFWSRILRERFGRDVTLVVDWGSFISGSKVDGWPLYPLNIQQAGIERLLYAITGLMDDDKRFSTAAIDRIESLYVANAQDINGVKLAIRKGRLTYHCYAGDWDGYYTIDEIRNDLKGRIIGKTRIRKMVERWLETASDHDEPLEREPQAFSEETRPVSETPIQDEQPIQDEPEYEIEEYDVSLRTELESLYNDFINTIKGEDLDGLLSMVDITRTDEEMLRREMSSDGLASFSEWMLTVYPQLDQTTFISLKSEDDDLAGYYMAWVPSYTNDYLNLTLITFEETGGQWRIVFRISEMASAILQVGENEDAMAKAQEVMRTDPLVELKRPETYHLSDEEMGELELSEEMSLLKAEFQAIYSAVYSALEHRDIKAFLSETVLSKEDEEKLRENHRNLFRAILEDTPEPSQTIFAKLQMRGEDQAGYYFVAPHPHNPSFHFVYLRPFVHREGRWKMVFSLEYNLAMNMSIARSEGDLPSRAIEVIEKIDLLNLEWVMSSLFEEIIS